MKQTEFEKWVTNALLFTYPLISIYLVATIGIIQINNHEFTLQDFIPSKFTQGAMVLYTLNTIQDYIRKYLSSKYN